MTTDRPAGETAAARTPDDAPDPGGPATSGAPDGTARAPRPDSGAPEEGPGGAPDGDSAAGGSAVGDSAAGESSAGDFPADGSPVGDSPADGSPVGDSPAADSPAGGASGEPAAGGERAAADGPSKPAGTAASPPSGTAGDRHSSGPGAPPADGGGTGRTPAAEALAAAVRAVESGERSAASFFTEQNRPAPPRPARSEPHAAPSPAPAPAPAPAPTAAPAPAPQSGRAAAPPRPVRTGPPPAERMARAATLREVLVAGGAPEELSEAVFGALGERAAETLRADPWQLLAVPGVRPEQADAFARALIGGECGPDDERRAQALIGWLLERAALEGHTALEPSAVSSALARRSVPDPEEALHTAIADGGVLVFQDALDSPGAQRSGSAGPRAAAGGDGGDAEGEGEERPVRVLLGLDRYALAEESLADGLARLVNTFAPRGGPASADDPAAAPEAPAPDADTPPGGSPEAEPSAGHADSAGAWQAAADAAASPSAAELIRAAADSGLVVHTGGEAARAEPAAVVTAARALGLRAFAAAHSEDGRRRLAGLLGTGATAPERSGTGQEAHRPEHAHEGAEAAVTVAGLLSGAEGPGRDGDGAFALDVLVVLDAPQLDVESAAMLVESLPDGARLVLSGDPVVLWSAGPGRVFADLLAARTCPQVASRTPDPGPIGELVSGIGVGELGEVAAPGKEVVIVPVRDAGEAVHRTVQLVADSVPRAIGIPSDHVQVITPGHGGAAGTRALNAALKERLNPGPGRFGGFDPGDRVAHVPAPGRTLPGTVVSADAEGLHLDCAGEPVVVPRELVGDTVRHGWALTAHQAAGTRWPAAVVVLPGDATAALTRSWVYTAFSRAEQQLSVVHGVEQALPRAVSEVPVKERTTRLRALLNAQEPPAG
ncbi:helix-hairpin-helix domain-containing protein [Streptomyces sp. NPDC002055]|uniref:helix-hairpin-helix domain-containing protein n=1 Tax=Streptomyces sp. NPDC002055 TaxID=3154534 RepID=UPI003330C267